MALVHERDRFVHGLKHHLAEHRVTSALAIIRRGLLLVRRNKETRFEVVQHT